MEKQVSHTIANISHVQLTGYKSIIDLQINFTPNLNIIIGRNGSGKTNLLYFIHQSLQFSYPLQETLNIHLQFQSPDHKQYQWTVHASTNNQVEPSKLSNVFETSAPIEVKETLKKDNQQIYQETFSRSEEYQNELVNRSFQIFSRTQLIQSNHFIAFERPNNLIFLDRPGRIIIQPPRRVEHSQTKGAFKFIQTLVSQLVKQLLHLPNTDSAETEMLNELITKQITPHLRTQLKKYSPIEDIRFAPEMLAYRNNGEIICTNLILEFQLNNKWHRWTNLSDASRRLFQIISNISFHDDQVFLLEEPELGLDLRHQDSISAFLNEEAQTKQIIVSTNTPRILNSLSAQQLDGVLICQLQDDRTTINTISKEMKQQIIKAKKEGISLGQWWYNSPYYR